MSVYVTGDCHAEFSRFYPNQLKAANLSLTPDDIVIVAGDMGLPWGEENTYGPEDWPTKWSYADTAHLRFLKELPAAILFIDGNHENFDLYRDIPYVSPFYGGKAQKLADNVYHLLRGEVYTIQGKTFFTMGGATSIDKAYRRERISWWPQEIPSYQEWEHAFTTLDKYNWNVDYVITHTCPDVFLQNRKDFDVWPDGCPVRQMLNRIEQQLTYGWWYFGHYHEIYDDPEMKCSWLYQNIKKIL